MTDTIWLTDGGKTFSEKVFNVNEKKGMAVYYVPWPCGRCGGAGGSQAWAFTGWTCYECGGHGHRGRVRPVKVYTPEAHAKLIAGREKRAAVKAAKNAAIVAARVKVAQESLITWRADNAALAAALDVYVGASAFIIELRSKLNEYGVLSDKQVTALESALAREAVKAAALDCPTGRVLVDGEILTVRDQESKFGFVTKMLVMAKDGYKVWMTAPKALRDPSKGMHVAVTVTVERSGDDSKFGFGSRPVLEAVK
jgi:hypothetical protein